MTIKYMEAMIKKSIELVPSSECYAMRLSGLFIHKIAVYISVKFTFISGIAVFFTTIARVQNST